MGSEMCIRDRYKRDKFRSRAVESFLEFAADFVPPPGAVPSTGFCG